MKSYCKTMVFTVLLIPLALMAQGTITGYVSDLDGNAVHGANVIVERTDLGAATDAEGYFEIAGLAAGEAVVIVDFIGFKQARQTISVPAEGTIELNFVLVSSVLRGEEVVVVGYGTQLRREITGSVAQISNMAFRDMPAASFENAIQGRISGVDIQEHTGEPGAAPNIRIRGAGSITAGNDPLYVIDGLPISNNLVAQGSLFRRRSAFKPPASNPLASLNPNDIESIQILKDASAAAIYGSRGSNGVVIITTKKGKEGAKPVFRFDAYTGTQEVANTPDMMNAKEVIAYTQDSRNNNYIQQYDPLNSASPSYNSSYDPTNNNGRVDANGDEVGGNYLIPDKYVDWDGTDTDWLSLIFHPAPISNYNLSVSGGGAGFAYFVSGGYLNQEGIIDNSQFQRFTIVARLNGKINESVRFGVNLNSAFIENDRVPANAPYFGRPPGIVYSAMVHSPVIKPYNDDGTPNQLDGQSYLGNGTTSASNPLAIIDAISETLDNHRTFGNVYTDIELIKGLVYRSSVGVDLSNYQESFYRANSLLYRTAKTGDPYAQSTASRSFNWLWENTVNYKTSFNEVHNVTALVGYTAQKDVVDQNSVIASNFSDDQVQTLSGGLVTDGTSIKEEWSLVSMLARLNYNFKYRYLFTAAVRSDRSSRFGEANQTGVFPSISVAWRLSEEPFVKRATAISELKIRASYGVTGNFLIPNYGAIGLLGQGLYILGDQPVNAVYPSTISNEDLGWETTRQTDFGVDFGLFDDRVYGTFDIYNSQTEDLLLEVGVQSALGFTTALTNIGKVKNTGFEMSVTSRNMVGAFQWATDFNYSSYKNEVLELGPDDEPIISAGSAGQRHITRVGDPIGSYYGYVVAGIYQNQADIDSWVPDDLANKPQPGDFKFKDINGDGKITTDDRTVTGSYLPDFTYGFTNRFSFKDFDLSIFFQGVEGREILNLTARHMKNGEANFNSYAVETDRWRSETEPGNGEIPRADRATSSHGNNNRPSSFQVEDGSYLRLKTLTIGYTLPPSVATRFAQSVRVYVSGKNLITWTDYIGFNPEVSLQSQNMLVQGEDYGAYPLARTWTFGISATF